MRFVQHVLSVESRALAGNPLGDPATRALPVLAPEGTDGQELPLVFLLAGFSGIGAMMLPDDPWAEGMAQRLGRLLAAGRIGPMRVALPDCFTRYGGSQYLNSPGTGQYEDYLVEDLVGAIRAAGFGFARAGVCGKSSGGYGALVLGMRHPDLFSAVASHSGDLYFDYCLQRDFPKVARTLARWGGVEGFLAHFAKAPKKRDGALMETINILAMASCYSPDPSKPGGFALPFDLSTAEIDPAVWARWLAWDPVRMIERPEYQAALRGMRLVHVECGTRDEFFLDFGARIFARRLAALGIRHRHEEFDDTHMSITYRYDVSLPLLWEALR